MNHTPTPWIDIPQWDPSIAYIGTATGTTQYVATLRDRRDGTCQANAAYIVRACNSYEAMRETLVQVKNVLETHGNRTNISIIGAIDLINSTLTLAEGKE